MSNQPLSSKEQVFVGVFIALMIPPTLLLVGIVPSLILIWGSVMTRRNKDFSYLKTSASVVQVLLGLSSIGWFLSSIFEFVQPREASVLPLVLAFVSLFYFLAIKFLFIRHLSKHSGWVEQHGIFSSKQKATAENTDMDILKEKNKQQYSVADELLKWVNLKEQGHISDAEFNEARKKLLQKS